MIVGNFSHDTSRDTYTGEMTTLTLQPSNVAFRSTDKVGDRKPDDRILQERDYAVVEFGAAWKRSRDKGRDFLSVMLDDSALPASLHAALFLSNRDDSATPVWQRQARKGNQTYVGPQLRDSALSPQVPPPGSTRSYKRPSLARRGRAL